MACRLGAAPSGSGFGDLTAQADARHKRNGAVSRIRTGISSLATTHPELLDDDCAYGRQTCHRPARTLSTKRAF